MGGIGRLVNGVSSEPRLGVAGAGYSLGVSAMFVIYLVLIVGAIVLFAIVGLAGL